MKLTSLLWYKRSQDVTYLCPRMFGCFWWQFNKTVLLTSSFNMYLTATYHSLVHLYTERERGEEREVRGEERGREGGEKKEEDKKEVGRWGEGPDNSVCVCVLLSLTSFLTVSAILGVLKVMYDTLQY